MKRESTRALILLLLGVLAPVSSLMSAAAPPVTITAPTDGTILAAPASFSVRASVSGGGNNVSQIEFFLGTNSLGVDNSNPYRIDVENLAAGVYTLRAVLTDNVGGTSSNSVDIIVNALPSLSITNPPDGAGLIAPATFWLAATADDSDGTVAKVQFFRGTTSLGVVTNPPYAVQIRNLGVGTYTYSAVATDNLGGSTRVSIDLLAKNRPVVAYSSPAAGARLTAVSNVITGTATDSKRVSLVECSLNGGAFAPVHGSNAWNFPVVLPAGTNVLRVRATDIFGNLSLTNTRSVFQVVTSALTLTVTGTGTVAGATSGQFLEVARGYRLTATPGLGYVFSNWTGQASGVLPTLNFLMQTNMVVQANFVPNPFLRVAGTFNGLYFETNAVRHESSGDVRLRVTASGRYSGVLRLAGRRYAASGQLDLQGRGTNSIVRPGTNTLTVTWGVDLHGLDVLTGTVSDGQWVAELLGDRALFNAATNAAPYAGRSTFVVPPSFIAATPAADGWGTLKVNASGVAVGVGCLADGTKFVRKAPLSKNGAWPLYAPLYQLHGLLIGWIQFTNAPLEDLTGLVDWLKPTQPLSLFYPLGFTNQTTLTGSRYLPGNATNRVLALTNGAVILSGGNLSRTWTNAIALDATHHVSNASPNQLTLTLSPATGLFKGSFLDTGTVRTVAFRGAVLQKSTNGAGFFLGTNQSGRVLLEARP
jgi:hypothetical protein